MGGNQVKALGFSPDTIITEQLLEKLWTKYAKNNALSHDAAVSLLKDLLKVYGIKFNKSSAKSWLSQNGLPSGTSCDRKKFSDLILAHASKEKLTMSEILTLEAEVAQKGSLFFGVPLGDIYQRIQSSGKEHITTLMIRSLRKRAMNEEGLFRLAGNKGGVRKLQLMVDIGRELDFDQYPIHDVSSLLKIFYRELPEPIIPFDSYEGVVSAARDTPQENTDELVGKLKKLVETLPEVNCLYLGELFSFMNSVAANSEVNKMSLRNLVIVMAPNLLRARETTVEKAMADYNHVNVAIQTLVSRNQDLFPNTLSQQQQSSSSSSSNTTTTTTTTTPQIHQDQSIPSSNAVQQQNNTVQQQQTNTQQTYDNNNVQQQQTQQQTQQTTEQPPPESAQTVTGRVLWDFDGMQGTGLVCRSGDVVEILSENQDQGEWIYCRKGTEAGYVPKNYIEIN